MQRLNFFVRKNANASTRWAEGAKWCEGFTTNTAAATFKALLARCKDKHSNTNSWGWQRCLTFSPQPAVKHTPIESLSLLVGSKCAKANYTVQIFACWRINHRKAELPEPRRNRVGWLPSLSYWCVRYLAPGEVWKTSSMPCTHPGR